MKSVMQHSFSQVPSSNTPRSAFNRSRGLKTTFDADYIYPVFWDEILPGDTISVKPSAFIRMATPINPVMDNLYADIHFFSVPVRQVWDNFRKFMGERIDPADSIDFTVPVMTAHTVAEGSIGDYFGLPTQLSISYNSLLHRCYNHVYNEWMRDQNLIDSATVDTDDGPDTNTDYVLRKRGKRHDYFTSSLPFLQKGEAIELPLGTSADIAHDGNPGFGNNTVDIYSTDDSEYKEIDTNGSVVWMGTATGGTDNKLYADLSSATAATINELRQAFQIQALLERDARTGTRYAEIVNSHFGVKFLDVTYRPEFLGMVSTPINMHVVPQTSSTDATTPQGNVSAFATGSMNEGGFTKSFTEHCYIIGVVSTRADLTYQQGLDRMFSRSTRYDFYWPALANLGEQSVLNKEIYYQNAAADDNVFGYQERWSEYRYAQSRLTGKMRSNATGTLDPWHLSQEFGSLPTLNQTFIESAIPMSRVEALPSEPDFIGDFFFDVNHVRPMPVHSVPGLMSRF